MSTQTVGRTIFSRWLAVLALVGISAVTAHLVVPWGWEFARAMQAPQSVNRVALHAASWLLLMGVGFAVARFEPVRLRHLRHVRRYPPLWLALPLSAPVLWLGHRCFPSLQFFPVVVHALWPWQILQAATAVIAGYLTRGLLWPTSENDLRAVAAPTRSSGEPTWPVIERWMGLERESEEDLLDHAQVATRFARILTGEGELPRTSAALVGARGSGKTTLLRWVAAELQEKDSEVWCCWVSCWGIQDSKQLAGYVLRSLISRIGREVDAFDLRGIPDSYVRVLGETKLGALAWLFPDSNERDVLEQTGTISSVLAAVNAKVVLFVEDGDRTGGKDFDHGHLERLLWRLRDLDRVSTVIALDHTRAQIDLSKLSEHIERIPRLSTEVVRTVLGITRDHCLDAFAFNRPAKPGRDRDRLDLFRADDGGLLHDVRRLHDRDVCDTMRDLIETPRRLKHVVRRVARAWENLYGEVDIDDLIALSVLRECCPSVLNFLLANIDGLRNRPDDFNKRPEAAKRDWETLIGADPTSAMAVPLVQVLGLEQLRTVSHSSWDVPQGIQHDEPTDYFQRLMAEQLAPGELRDQTVLSDIESWLQSRSQQLVDRLSGVEDGGDRYARVWEHFAWRIGDDHLPELVEDLFDRILKRVAEDGKWTENRAFKGCWRESIRRGPTAVVKVASLSRMITAALPESLFLATDLYYYWASPLQRLCSADERVALRRTMVTDARRSLSSGEALLRALRFDREGWALRALVQPADQKEPPSVETEAERWNWLSRPVVDALRAQPAVVERQVARLVRGTANTLTGRGPTTIYAINRERTNALFGTDLPELLHLLANMSSTAEDPSVREAGSQARSWLAELTARGGID